MGIETVDTFDDAAASNRVLPATRWSTQLVLVLQANRPLSGGARWALDDIDQVIIGRGTQLSAVRETTEGHRTLRVLVPARSMSGIHARLVRSRAAWILEDARSRNGSYVNGQRVERTALTPESLIELGHAFFVVREYELPRGVDADCVIERADPHGLSTLVPAFQAMIQDLRRVATAPLPIVLLGETGTGKEIFARAVHALSGRKGPFIPVNCGGLAEGVLTSQLFGHVRGAFSGAIANETGVIRAASGGTLFLDEVGEMPLASQAALLRVLQDGEVLPVGATRPVNVDLRVVAATNRSLADEAAACRFRSDLLARLSGFAMTLPPLRERREDLGVLVASLLTRVAPDQAERLTLTREAGAALFEHEWPHNIRELGQTLARAAVLASESEIRVSDLMALRATPSASARVREPTVSATQSDEDARLRAVLLGKLRDHHGNIAAVAREMGKATMQIHRWMKRFGIDPNAFRR